MSELLTHMRNRLSQLVYEKSIILSAKADTRYDIRTEAERSPLSRASDTE